MTPEQEARFKIFSTALASLNLANEALMELSKRFGEAPAGEHVELRQQLRCPVCGRLTKGYCQAYLRITGQPFAPDQICQCPDLADKSEQLPLGTPICSSCRRPWEFRDAFEHWIARCQCAGGMCISSTSNEAAKMDKPVQCSECHRVIGPAEGLVQRANITYCQDCYVARMMNQPMPTKVKNPFCGHLSTTKIDKDLLQCTVCGCVFKQPDSTAPNPLTGY